MNMAKESGLVYSLVKARLITADKGKQLEIEAEKEGKPLVSYIVESKIVTSEKIKEIFEREYGYPYLDLDDFEVKEISEKFINEKVIMKNHALPVYTQGKTLYLAMSDPTNVNALDEFSILFAMHTDIILVDEKKLQKAIGKLFQDAMNDLDVGLTDDEFGELVDEDESANANSSAATDTGDDDDTP